MKTLPLLACLFVFCQPIARATKVAPRKIILAAAPASVSPQSSTRFAAPSVSTPSVSTPNDVAPNAVLPNLEKTPLSTLQLAPDILQILRTRHVWSDPSLGETVDENAISLSMRDLGFPVRVLVARALPPETASVRNLAQIVAQQADNWDGLTLVATTDDAHMALFASFLKPDDAREIEAKSAQTWTQQGVAVGVAQTLRLVSSQRKLQRQSWFLRIVLPTIIGVSCLFAALFSWIRRKLKHHARRKISKNLPTTIPITDEIGSEA